MLCDEATLQGVQLCHSVVYIQTCIHTYLQAQKVLQKSEQMARNEHVINYDDRNAFVIDSVNLTPIDRGSPSLRCSYCGSSYAPELKGGLCVTCGISQIGVETLGLVTSAGASSKR